jgi:hypothetical protein
VADSAFWDWVSSDDYTEYKLKRSVRGLQSEVDDANAAASRQASTLRSQTNALRDRMAALEGSLEDRLDRLSKSFYAFVELSELRRELDAFKLEESIRADVRRLIAGLVQRAVNTAIPAPPPLNFADCPGYWLPSAAEALSALARGDEVTSETHLVKATACDAERTAVFLALSLTMAGEPELAAHWLDRALPSLRTEVTEAERALWIAAAHNAFGPAGRRLVIERLAAFIAELPTDQAAREHAQWTETLAKNNDSHPLPIALRSIQKEADPILQAARLSRLRAWTEEAEKAKKAEDKETEEAQQTKPALDALIAEGAPAEAPLREQASALWRVINPDHADTAWNEPAGATLDLLRGDIFAPIDVPVRSVALRGARTLTTAVVADLTMAAIQPPPATVVVVIESRQVELTPGQSPSTAAAEAAIDESAGEGWIAKRRAADWLAHEKQRLVDQAEAAARDFDRLIEERQAAAEQAKADRDAILAEITHTA